MVMLKRILSATFLILVLVPIIIAGGKAFSIAIGILALLGLKEIFDLKKSHSDIPSGIMLFSMCMLLFLIFYEFELHSFGISFQVLAILSIGLLFPTLLDYKKKKYETKDTQDIQLNDQEEEYQYINNSHERYLESH